MLRFGSRGRLLFAVAIASGVFLLSRDWATQLATLPRKPITKSSCPASFFVVAEKPGGQYALMAVFDYSDELKSDFYRHSKDRNKTGLLLQETWPTAEVLWPDVSDVDLQVSDTALEDATSFLNGELAETHEKLGLFPTVLDFQYFAADSLGSGPNYRLVIERGHIPEIYLYRVEAREFVPVAYITENRLGGVFVSLLLGAISVAVVLLLPPMGRLLGSANSSDPH